MAVRPSALLLCVALVAASSFPDNTGCLAEDPSLDTLMKWVQPAVRTDAYTLRTGDGCSGDPTSYIPGQTMSIHLRTHKYKGQFRGLLLYATDANNNKVGDWELNWPNSNMFWKPSNAACQNRSLMHLNGAEKYYHHEFKFMAPAANTGTITFHCLLKRGQANTGEFYWPNMNANLMLAEGGVAGATVWVEGNAGENCDTACSNSGKGACASTLLSKSSTFNGALQRDVVKSVGCNEPALVSDTAVGVSKDNQGWCVYPSPLAPASGITCSAIPASGKPICPCGSPPAEFPSFGATIPLPDTACLNAQVVMGAAPKASSGLSFLLVVLSGLFLNQHKPTNFLILLSCVFYCAYTVEAHNWVFTVSRSFNQASTYKPCRPKVNDVPHWQIKEGLEFTIEWATGHDHYFYFTVVHADDILKLENTTQRDLDDYLKACQAGDDYMRSKVSRTGAAASHWRKQHINHDAAAKTSAINPTTQATVYDRNISSTDPAYIPRHVKFGLDPREVRWIYLDAYTKDDLRCSYYNPTNPHLIAVHRFVQVETVMSRAGDRDTAAFTIELHPTHKSMNYGSGQYLVQYLWRGYFDCIDVELFPDTVTLLQDQVGGRELRDDEPQWNKVDHCQFEEIQSIESNCAEVITHADRCLDACARNDNCNGVNVVPMWLPKTVYPLFSNRVGIPWDDMGRCARSRFADLNRHAKVCYGLQPRLPNNTHAMYSVSDDPEDPVFYATCFIKRSRYTFDLSLVAAANITVIPVPPSWSFSDKCVDCMEWKAAQTTHTIPTWNIPTNCVNCETATLPPVPALPGSLVASGVKCDGSYSGATRWYYHNKTAQCQSKRCVKTLFLVGANGIDADECIAKAKADPECSEFVQHNGERSNGCECFLKDPCCGKCVPADYDFRNWEWNIYTTSHQVGDINCAKGVKSLDNAYCCSAECTEGCMPRASLQVSFQDDSLVAPVGWAVDKGDRFGLRTNTYPSPAGWNEYGWNCDPTSEDREDDDGSNFHSTVLRADSGNCATTGQWDVTVPNGDYHVETLFTKPFASIRGCRLQGNPNYDSNHAQLGQNDMAWVVRNVNTTSGKLSFGGGSQCTNLAAVVIYPLASVQSPQSYCQSSAGMCCPILLDIENRPCASFDPPCKL